MPNSERSTRSRSVPSLEGWIHPDFYGVARVLRRQIRSYEGGAAVCVYHRGRRVVDLWGGVRNGAGDPWEADTMAPSFSTTKGVASTLIHIMRDRGLLDYDERVATYWPEFAASGKSGITLRQVLTHQSGLYHIRQMIDHADQMRDWDHMVAALEAAQPIHTPGERTGYHGLTYGFLVGEILQRVTGRSFSELVQEELARPLVLDGLFVGAPDEVHDRAAELMWSAAAQRLRERQSKRSGAGQKPDGPLERIALGTLSAGGELFSGALGRLGLPVDFGSIADALAPRGIREFEFDSADTLRSVIPAANGLFTARSLAQLYAVLANGGVVPSEWAIGEASAADSGEPFALFSAETFALATERQPATARSVVIPFDMRWRLGYHGVATTRGFPPAAFGHFGFGGSGAWADPDHDLSVALIVNCGMGTPFGDTRTARISGAALDCAKRRP